MVSVCVCVLCICMSVCACMCVREEACVCHADIGGQLFRSWFFPSILSLNLSFLFLRLHCVLQTSSPTHCQLILLLPPILLVFGHYRCASHLTFHMRSGNLNQVTELVKKKLLPTEPSLQPYWTISPAQLNYFSSPIEPPLQPSWIASLAQLNHLSSPTKPSLQASWAISPGQLNYLSSPWNIF